eukprot:TRINITY_DN1968_c0_g1_i2.p1 TRINITY_DN1968_c0_g1~~TRINITY_DN1968_c0_g1_i2.p1  ORF type:complete len:116 (-),score=24.56 TRINITY_DN1968_c0_g1_i2:80-427(-)
MSVKTSNDMISERPVFASQAPPGGKSSISFSDGSTDTAPPQRESRFLRRGSNSEVTGKIGAAPSQQAQPSPPRAAAPPQQQQQQPQGYGQAQQDTHTGVKVRQAPGGASSFSLGW